MWYNNGTLNRSEACLFGWNYDPEIGPTIVTDVRYQNTLKEHQKFLANAIFQKFLISMVMHELFFPKNILNHSSQFSKDFLEIYIWKNIVKYGHPNYIETFMDSMRMTQIFMDSCTIDTPL